VYKNESGSFTTKGGVNVLQVPHDIIWKNPIETIHFNFPPVFKTNHHSALVESIRSIKQTILKTQKLEAAISSLVESEKQRVFQPKFIYDINQKGQTVNIISDTGKYIVETMLTGTVQFF